MLSNLTIAIPTLNRNDYLNRLLQTIPDEFGGDVVISDNGSYVSNEIKLKYPDYKIYSTKEIVKMFQNWNLVIDKIETEWFILPSDDDLFLADSFVVMDRKLEEFNNADILIFGHNVINENDEYLSEWKPTELLSLKSPNGYKPFASGVDARLPSIIFRTAFVREMGKFNEDLEITAADSFLIQKCLLYGNSIYVPHILASYRIWPNNFTNQLISSRRWLDTIDLWQDKLAVELINLGIFDDGEAKDEVYAENILSALNVMNRNNKGALSKFKFILNNRYPKRAKFYTKLRIAKKILFK